MSDQANSKGHEIFWVDLPDPARREPDGCYIQVGTFRTEAEARAFLETVHGITGAVAEFFISTGWEES